MNYYALDRIEGNYGVLIDDEQFSVTVETTFLNGPLAEGTVFVKTDKGYQWDEAETSRRKKIACDLHKKLFGKG